MTKYIEIDGIGEVVPRSEYDALAAQVYRFVTAFNEGTNDDVILTAAEISEEVSNAYHLEDLNSDDSKDEIARLKNLALLAAEGMIATASEGIILSEKYAKLEEQNAVLAAQVEALRMAIMSNCYDDPSTSGQRLMELANKTQQQHLAEIRAQAGRDGFFKGVAWILDIDVKDISAMVAEEAANQYAENIRQGGAK